MISPWNVSLPTTLTVAGKDYTIRSDYRVALDIFQAITDPELDDYNRAMEALECLYEEEIPPQYYKEALDRCFWYLRGGVDETGTKSPKLVSWEQDFRLIEPPVSKIIGTDIRGLSYLHWWTFLSAYSSIGDCFFAQVVAIRDKKARGKTLDKADREFYRRNRDVIDFKVELTEREQEIFDNWLR